MDYKQAGVDISALNKVKKRISRAVKETFTDNVVTEYGHFGGGFRLEGYKKPVLVSSTDSVGTKVKVAQAAGTYGTVGADIVNHSVNDIACTGARPLYFLDYIAFSKLDSSKVADIVVGVARACKKEGIALIGGETAQLPGVYKKGDFDLVGTIVGALEEGTMVDGRDIRSGNVAVGLRSSGLHTNGYSLARKVLLDKKDAPGLDALVPGTKKTVARALLAVHKSYLNQIEAVRHVLKGAAHITGGGFTDNISRLLPDNVDCIIDKKTWKPLPIFSYIQKLSGIPDEEAYRVFNMGIGMILFVQAKDAERVVKVTRGKIIGGVERGSGKVYLR
ncbi:phosphoribosylformylglycinamidine cyclo-ligase [candidate division WOR-3 bacterium]|uniref:Phosphoribosylformylglycinamidine cyclo-ligase n=1 Tax=candidate division WOR-3 bacterium TaxID=2052148 RepID=A0A9D5QCG3_UNCW3|nr:phosphoribosylformylglycinamidine cyclo-ligase [candidate division WOR-3 bacterium]MBD3363956.1 phosphoribosylformylglycinamidine cyclo-ligase [candidate division WOR-3 bacterium]